MNASHLILWLLLVMLPNLPDKDQETDPRSVSFKEQLRKLPEFKLKFEPKLKYR